MHQLPKEHLDISTHQSAAGGGAGEWGRSANAYLRQETAKFRISQSSTSLLFPSPYKRAWMRSSCASAGVKFNFSFSPQWSLARAALICMRAWIRILCAPSNSGASVFASIDSAEKPRVQ